MTPTGRYKHIRYFADDDNKINLVRREYVLFFDVDYDLAVLMGGPAAGHEMVVRKDVNEIPVMAASDYDPQANPVFRKPKVVLYKRVANTRAFYSDAPQSTESDNWSKWEEYKRRIALREYVEKIRSYLK